MQSITQPEILLPDRVPLFPLSGVVMMPFAHLPFNVFEDRYIAMMDDALAGSRMIGLVQPKDDTVEPGEPIATDAPLYGVGTLGRVYAFIDPGEGAYQVTLQGVVRFAIESEEVHANGYRVAKVNYQPYMDDLKAVSATEGPGREQLVELMHGFANHHEMEVDWDAVDDAAYHALVASLIMSSPFSSSEKQALLESTDAQERARLLMQIIHMTLETRGVAGSARH